jgi:hypothetical protein
MSDDEVYEVLDMLDARIEEACNKATLRDIGLSGELK